MANGEEKYCPYRSFTEKTPTGFHGKGDYSLTDFLPCLGDLCMAYRDCVCLRLKRYNNERDGG